MVKISGLIDKSLNRIKSEDPAIQGYTLIETLIAFVILMVILVPCIGYLYRLSGGHDAEKKITAICILEQEAAIVRTFPDKKLPVKRRMVNNSEWLITTEVTGSGLLRYRMAVSDGKRDLGEVVFYGRE